MSRVSFFLWHGLVLLTMLIPPKLHKAQWLAADVGWPLQLKLLLPDLAFVLFSEALALGLARATGARAGRWLRAA
jgi:hypothetical protein